MNLLTDRRRHPRPALAAAARRRRPQPARRGSRADRAASQDDRPPRRGRRGHAGNARRWRLGRQVAARHSLTHDPARVRALPGRAAGTRHRHRGGGLSPSGSDVEVEDRAAAGAGGIEVMGNPARDVHVRPGSQHLAEDGHLPVDQPDVMVVEAMRVGPRRCPACTVSKPAIDVSVDHNTRFVTPSAGPVDVVMDPVGSLLMASGVNTVGRAVVVPMTSECAAAYGAARGLRRQSSEWAGYSRPAGRRPVRIPPPAALQPAPAFTTCSRSAGGVVDGRRRRPRSRRRPAIRRRPHRRSRDRSRFRRRSRRPGSPWRTGWCRPPEHP